MTFGAASIARSERSSGAVAPPERQASRNSDHPAVLRDGGDLVVELGGGQRAWP